MTLTVPLTVTLVTDRAHRDVTAELRDLSFREQVPGGFATAELSLDRPLALQPDEVTYYGQVRVHDARNGSVVWEGRLEDMGRSVGADGQVWRLGAVGPSTHAQDRKVPLVYVDRRYDQWQLHGSSQQSYERADVSGAGATEGVQLVVRQGGTVTSGAAGRLWYRALRDAGQLLGRVSTGWDAGATTSADQVGLATNVDDGTSTTATTANWSTAGGTLTASRGGSPAVPSGHNVAQLLSIRAGASATVADDAHWATFNSVVVRALLKDATGADVTTGYGTDVVLASDVVRDLLGRLLTRYDGAGAAVATTSFGIEQLAYPDGCTAAQVLDDLMKLHADHYWAAWEANEAGRHRFEWTPWPTAVRYEAEVLDGFDSPASGSGLYNGVLVRWRDAAGQVVTTYRTQSVPELTAAGLTRDDVVDLGDEVGSLANAQRVGDQWLAEHRYPPNAGRLTIARPVADLLTGRMVQPWEVRAGTLVRVGGVLPNVDALNASARDGVTVFRVVARDYDASANTATLELDSYAAGLTRALADVRRSPVLAWRRR